MVAATSGAFGINAIVRSWTSKRPGTAGWIESRPPRSVTPSWSKVTSMPVSTGTPVVSLPGSVPTTWSGRSVR
ncbi:MAG: hypothetical protein L0227_03445 [Chloroflexi bacterium]|nr:hypothetical protein [Chloroflexota bacterium]